MSFSQGVDSVEVDSSASSLTPHYFGVIGEDTCFCWREKDQVPLVIEHVIKSEAYDSLNILHRMVVDTANSALESCRLERKFSEKQLLIVEKQNVKWKQIAKNQKKQIVMLKTKSKIRLVISIPLVFGTGFILGKYL